MSDLRYTLAAALAAGAAALHLAAASLHAGSTADVVAFSAMAWAQLLLAAGLLVRPRRALLVTGAVMSTLFLSTWALSRSTGLPWGANAGVVEAIGTLDLAAVALEALLVALALVPPLPRLAARSQRVFASAGVLAIVLVSSAAMAWPGTAHELDHASGDGQAQDGHASHECSEPATAAQQAAADDLVARTRAAAARYEALDVAVADGFVPITPEGRRVVHYGRASSLGDGVTLDPTDIESLVYGFDARNTPYLLGAMYLLDSAVDEPPTPGGCLTAWHAHDNLCIAPDRGMVAVVADDGSCPAGSRNSVTAKMLHVWSIDLPTGPFSELDEVDPAAVVAALRAGR